MRRKNKTTLFVVGGVMILVIIFMLFIPAILGSASASSDLEKYNGTSDAGNQSVKTAGVINNFLATVSGLGMYLVVFSVAIVIVCAAIMMMLRRH